MNTTFYKYQGTGNDFILIDNRVSKFPKENTTIIKKLCDRHFGIGADGLILLENDHELDFKMVYYNADGNESTMCGNGGRCIVAFANKLGIVSTSVNFRAIDGLHSASIEGNIVSLHMIDVNNVNVFDNHVFANTGSPHHVELVEDIDNFDIVSVGRKIRHEVYGKEGSNVNFIEQKNDDTFRLRTYERGVEDETLACGTGATAAALAMYHTQKTNKKTIHLIVQGGNLTVSFVTDNNGYKNIYLTGPADFVFEGKIAY